MKFYRVKSPGKEIEPQEVLLDALTQKREKEKGVKELKLELPTSQRMLKQFLFFCLLLLGTLLAKTFQLTILQNKDWTEKSQNNFSRLTPLRTDRGIIYDRNFQKLVTNLPSFDLVLDKRDFSQETGVQDEEIKKMAEILGQDAEDLKNTISQNPNPTLVLAENLEQPVLIKLESQIEQLKGLRLEKNTIRNYIDGPAFAQVLGYMGRINPQEYSEKKDENYFVSDYLGKQGLEKYYEKALRGQPGLFETIKNARGQKIKEGIKTQPESGQSLILSLDADLQRKLQSELSRVLLETNTRKGAALALDPSSGEILALVSLPSFDNNLFSQGKDSEKIKMILENPDQPLFNRAVAGLYASGSAIKPLIATAALQEKVISPEKQILDKGYIEIKNQYDPKITYVYHGVEAPGLYNMRRAIALSANIYFYTIGGGYLDQKGLGLSRIKKYLELFGWGKKTNIDLPQEAAGFIPDSAWKKEVIGENWYIGDTYNLSIGQGYLQVTPLQLATAFMAIANGGKIYEPRLVQKIIQGTPQDPKVIQEFTPEISSELNFDPQNMEIVRQGMRDGVVYGSSAILNDLPVKAASKTGTAQTSRNGYYYNWVATFAPLENPKIVLVVMIEDMPGLRTASLLVANETLKWYFTR